LDTRTYAGRYSDGKTAATAAVTVTIGDGIGIAGASGPVRWTYQHLQAAAPLHWRDDEVLLRNDEFPGATLFIADPGFASALLKRAPGLSPSSHRWRYAVPGLLITAAVLIGIGAVYGLGLNPAQDVAALVPHKLRVSIGEQAVKGMIGGSESCSSTDGDKALAKLVNELSKATESGKDFNVRVVKSAIVNAFALPGEQVVLYEGLINEAQSADEVAGVLAHEMGHGIELHPEAGIIRSLGLTALIELLASGQSGTLTNTGALLLELRYSREAEHQADAHALRILKNANISPRPFSGFFKRLLKGGSSDGKSDASVNMGIFSTHPPTPERAQMAADAATYPGKPALTDAEWKALKAICG